jgi:hypothetical protein
MGSKCFTFHHIESDQAITTRTAIITETAMRQCILTKLEQNNHFASIPDSEKDNNSVNLEYKSSEEVQTPSFRPIKSEVILTLI